MLEPEDYRAAISILDSLNERREEKGEEKEEDVSEEEELEEKDLEESPGGLVRWQVTMSAHP